MKPKVFYTLAEVAERWNCSHSSVLNLVYGGDLRAIDISTNPQKRSRYIVPTENLEAFEASRATEPPAIQPVKRKRVKMPAGAVIEFFE